MVDNANFDAFNDTRRLMSALAEYAGEQLTASYLRPEKGAFRLVSAYYESVLNVLESSPIVKGASGDLLTQSTNLLGFTFHPRTPGAAARLLSAIQPSFAIETADLALEFIYLIKGTYFQIFSLREALDEGTEDTRTSETFTLPIATSRIVEPWASLLRDGGALNSLRPEAIQQNIDLFKMSA